MRGFRHAIDYANYSWNSHVVGYDQARQKDFLDNYFSSISPQLIAIFVILLVVLISMAVALIMFNVRPSVALSEMDLLYRRFQSYLRALGVSRAVGETPEQFQARAVSRLPHLEQTISRFTQTYVAQQYLPKSQVGQTRARAVNALKKDLRVLRGSVVRRRSRVMRFFDRFLFRRG